MTKSNKKNEKDLRTAGMTRRRYFNVSQSMCSGLFGLGG